MRKKTYIIKTDIWMQCGVLKTDFCLPEFFFFFPSLSSQQFDQSLSKHQSIMWCGLTCHVACDLRSQVSLSPAAGSCRVHNARKPAALIRSNWWKLHAAKMQLYTFTARFLTRKQTVVTMCWNIAKLGPLFV